jgi:hypothetical protein
VLSVILDVAHALALKVITVSRAILASTSSKIHAGTVMFRVMVVQMQVVIIVWHVQIITF